MVNIILGLLMLFTLYKVPGPPKIGILILLGLLFWMNRRRKRVRPQQAHEIKKDPDKDVVTLSKDQYKVN